MKILQRLCGVYKYSETSSLVSEKVSNSLDDTFGQIPSDFGLFEISPDFSTFSQDFSAQCWLNSAKMLDFEKS